jgi:hypothetical protein
MAATTSASGSSPACRLGPRVRQCALRLQLVDPRQQRFALPDEIVDLRPAGTATSPFRLSALSESICSGGIPSLNQTTPKRAMPHC